MKACQGYLRPMTRTNSTKIGRLNHFLDILSELLEIDERLGVVKKKALIFVFGFYICFVSTKIVAVSEELTAETVISGGKCLQLHL